MNKSVFSLMSLVLFCVFISMFTQAGVAGPDNSLQLFSDTIAVYEDLLPWDSVSQEVDSVFIEDIEESGRPDQPDFSSEEKIEAWLEESYPEPYKIFRKTREYCETRDNNFFDGDLIKSFEGLVNASQFYQGNIGLALDDMERIANIFTMAPQQVANKGYYYLFLAARLRATHFSNLNDIVAEYPEYRDIYNKWSDLLSLMDNYLVNVTYGEPRYSSQPMEYYSDMMEWREDLGKITYCDARSLDITNDDDVPTIGGKGGSQMVEIDEFNKIEGIKDIVESYKEYKKERERFADRLDPSKKTSFEGVGTKIESYILKEIESLTHSRKADLIE